MAQGCLSAGEAEGLEAADALVDWRPVDMGRPM